MTTMELEAVGRRSAPVPPASTSAACSTLAMAAVPWARLPPPRGGSTLWASGIGDVGFSGTTG